MKKYLCMMEGCDFVAEDVDEAKDHAQMGDEHMLIEVDEIEGNVSCNKMLM